MLNPKIDKKILAFDFDGTVADTKDLFLDSLIRFQKKYSKSQESLDKDYLNELISQGKFQNCIKELKIPILKIPSFFKEFKNYFQLNIGYCPTFEGIEETLENLHQSHNYTLLIISSNKKSTIEEYLKEKKINSLFSKIYSDNLSFKKHKLIKKSIEEELSNSNSIKMIYFGDETRDIDACKKSQLYYDYGLLIASVTWGYQNEDVLKKHNPDFIINHPKNIEKLLEFIEF
jgi:phosphoglycolate phosphatase